MVIFQKVVIAVILKWFLRFSTKENIHSEKMDYQKKHL